MLSNANVVTSLVGTYVTKHYGEFQLTGLLRNAALCAAMVL